MTMGQQSVHRDIGRMWAAMVLVAVAAAARPIEPQPGSAGLDASISHRRLQAAPIEDQGLDPAFADWSMVPGHDAWDFQSGGGTTWGDWRSRCRCRYGDFYHQFRTKVESDQGGVDDSAMNAVEFGCDGRSEDRSSHDGVTYGAFGSWSSWKTCPGNSLIVGLQMKVESPQGGGDDTSVNGIRVKCSDSLNTVLETSNTMDYGTWQAWRQCPAGHYMCKFVLRVEAYQYFGDDTEMNDIKFHCCKRYGQSQAAVKVVNKMGIPVQKITVAHMYNSDTLVMGFRNTTLANGAATGKLMEAPYYARYKYKNKWALVWSPNWGTAGVVCTTRPFDLTTAILQSISKMISPVTSLIGLPYASIKSLATEVATVTINVLPTAINNSPLVKDFVSADIWEGVELYPMDDWDVAGKYVTVSILQGYCNYFQGAILPAPSDADYPARCNYKLPGNSQYNHEDNDPMAEGEVLITTPNGNSARVRYLCDLQ